MPHMYLQPHNSVHFIVYCTNIRMICTFCTLMTNRQLQACVIIPKGTIVSEKQSRRFKQKDSAKLSLLGRYFKLVCQRLHVTWDQVAQEAGLDPSTISKAMSQRGNKPLYETLEKIVGAMSKHKGWLYRHEKTLLHLNHDSTAEEYDEAVQDLIRMEYIFEKYGPDYENTLENGLPQE